MAASPIEQEVWIETIRTPHVRERSGVLRSLADSIEKNGLRHPVAVWDDGTLLSGGRRLRAHFLLGKPTIRAVFVNTIEDAAKRLLCDNQDDFESVPMRASEMCRLWELLRRLDAPAAALRRREAQRRGIALRRETQAGKRRPGRSSSRSDDYVLGVICEPFAMSSATARRYEVIYQHATGVSMVGDDKHELAVKLLAELDEGSPVWPAYQQLLGVRPALVSRPKAVVPVEPAAAAKQRAAWDRGLPQLEGLIAGLAELGPPHPDLTWNEVGPVHAQLTNVRRELEKMIKKMKEIGK
jgi:hypothetical protein